MGISGGAYLANELATGNTWKKIDELITEIKNKNRTLRKSKDERAVLEGELAELDLQLQKLSIALTGRPDAASDDPDKLREGKINDRIAIIKGLLDVGPVESMQSEINVHKEELKCMLLKVYKEDPSTA